MSEPLFLEDLRPGMRFPSGTRVVDEAQLLSFAELSGDFNPLHVDEDFARSKGYERRIVHGALVFAIATGLRQQLGIFEGSMIAMLELRSWAFRAPVFVGDSVQAITCVLSVRPTSAGGRGIVVQDVEVLNQDRVVVQRGELVSMIAARHALEPR